MKIALFMNEYFPSIGGAQITTHCLATSLVENDKCNVSVITRSKLYNKCIKNKWKFKYKLLSSDPPSNLLFKISPSIWLWLIKKRFRKLLIKERFDIVHIIMTWPWLLASEEAKKLNIPVILRAAGEDIQISKLYNYGIRRNSKINKLIIKNFENISAAVAISETVVSEYLKINVDKKKIHLINPGINKNDYNFSVNKKELLNKYKIPTNKKIILSVGRNHPKKNFKSIILALKELNKFKNEYILIIVGKNTKNLISLAKDNNIEESFIPIDEISTKNKSLEYFPDLEIIKLYKLGDYFVFPSVIETYANVITEAMASEIPVIISKAPGCIDRIIDGHEGLFLENNNSKEIVKKIMYLENNPNLKKKIITNAKVKSNNLDWKLIAKKHLNLYKVILNNKN